MQKQIVFVKKKKKSAYKNNIYFQNVAIPQQRSRAYSENLLMQ